MTEYVNGWLTNLSEYIGGLNEELEKAKAENAELLRELDLTKRMYAKVSEEKCVADSENAKLRELVREIWRSCPVGEDDCAKCPHHIEESDEVWCDIPILMEELGVKTES